MTAIRFDHVTKIYTNADEASVVDVSLDVDQGSFVVLLGPSGCGKTTLLKMVNRLHEPTSGTIFMDGTDIRQIALTDLRRQIGYVIQQIGLFPHMTVARNVSIVPELLDWPRQKIDARVDELLALVNLEPGMFRDRYPAQLSGGQQQRVAIARALIHNPSLVLADEPTANLDTERAYQVVETFAGLIHEQQRAGIMVTHDLRMCEFVDRVLQMRDGKLIKEYADKPSIMKLVRGRMTD